MNVADRQDCELNIMRIDALLASGIFDSKHLRHPWQPSAFIELMICLRDLLHKVEKYAERIDFTDDVITNEYVNDVTGAVTAVRDACCHIDSFKRNFDTNGNRGAFNVLHGAGVFGQVNGVELHSDYDDDIAIFYGANRLLWNRHIIRVFEECKVRLRPHLEPRGA